RRLRHAGGLIFAGDDGRDRPPQHHGSLPRSAPVGALPASRCAGRPYNTDATALPRGTPKSRLLLPTTRWSSSTQVTLGAPTPPSTGPPRACTGPRVGQGRSSSLRCGRSTLTNTCGPERPVKRALTGEPTQVTAPFLRGARDRNPETGERQRGGVRVTA